MAEMYVFENLMNEMIVRGLMLIDGRVYQPDVYVIYASYVTWMSQMLSNIPRKLQMC